MKQQYKLNVAENNSIKNNIVDVEKTLYQCENTIIELIDIIKLNSYAILNYDKDIINFKDKLKLLQF